MKSLSFVYRYLFEEAHWTIGVAKATPVDMLNAPQRVQFTWIPLKASSADPAFATIGDKPALLYERIGEDRQGRLAFTALDTLDGSFTTLLEDAVHTSYPFAFEYQGDQYVIPERAALRRIDLYKLVDNRLEFTKTLIDEFAGLDATVVPYQGKWWMFVTDLEDLRNDGLRIFFADDPLGSWQPHASNPVKIDVRSARPAGKPFVHNDILYRPAQDCAGRYGRALAINEVVTITPECFEERIVRTIGVEDIDGLSRHVGVHTLAHTDGWIAIDAQSTRFSLRKPFLLARERWHKRTCT